MILVVGGLASGKCTFARNLGFSDADVALDVHELARERDDWAALADELATKEVVTCAEVGSGIVPLDGGERAWRERVGRMAATLAERADCVVRMVCGLPVVLKGAPAAFAVGEGSVSAHAPVPSGPDGAEGNLPTAARALGEKNGVAAQAANPPRSHLDLPHEVELVLVRHGQTPGNEEGRYVGVVDQALSEAGRAQARAAGPHPDVKRVYVSTLRRTHETAALMFPNAEQVIVDGIQEMDFGAFAGRTADEMADDAAYRAWVDGNCEGACPDGESQAAFSARVCAAMERLLREAAKRGERRIVIVAHGGTMMAFFSRYGNDPSKRYWEWLVGNCKGYRATLAVEDGGLQMKSLQSWPSYAPLSPEERAERQLRKRP